MLPSPSHLFLGLLAALCCLVACDQASPQAGRNTAPSVKVASDKPRQQPQSQQTPLQQPQSQQKPESTASSQPKPADQQDLSQLKFDHGVRVVLEGDDPRVEARGTLLGNQSRPLEYLIIGQGGPSHESLIEIAGKAYDIKRGLELLGLREGQRKLARRGDPTPPDGDPVDIFVRWDDLGTSHEVRIETWVYNRVTKEVMEAGPWTFTGSVTRYREELRREVFEADWLGNIVAVWRDPSCVIDNPRESATNDLAYEVNARGGNLPPQGTAVDVIFRPVKAAVDD